MGSGTLEMAKKRGRPKTSQRDDVTVRIDRKIKDMADGLARARGISTAELLSDLVEAPLTRAYLEMMRELERRVRGDGGTK